MRCSSVAVAARPSANGSWPLVRQHMFGYQPTWSDAAVRRFIAKVGPRALEDLFLLREADHIGSGREPDAGGLDELRARVAAQLEAGRGARPARAWPSMAPT